MRVRLAIPHLACGAGRSCRYLFLPMAIYEFAPICTFVTRYSFGGCHLTYHEWGANANSQGLLAHELQQSALLVGLDDNRKTHAGACVP